MEITPADSDNRNDTEAERLRIERERVLWQASVANENGIVPQQNGTPEVSPTLDVKLPDFRFQAAVTYNPKTGLPYGASVSTTNTTSTTQPDVWGSITSDPNERNALTQPLQTSEDIYNNWDQYGFGTGIPTANVGTGSSTNANAQASLAFASQNPALVNAWDANNDGTITRDEVNTYISETKSDIQKAEKAFSEYMAAHPNADAASIEIARNAALVAANRYLIGDGGTYLHGSHLGNFANNGGQGFSSSLLEAARMWSSGGMAHQFDAAGQNPALAKTDELFGVDDITNWLKTGAPANASDVASLLKNAAFYNISGGSTAGLTKDIFTNPGNYTPEQLVGALRELETLRNQVTGAVAGGLWDDNGAVWIANGAGINPNKDKVLADINAKIAILSADSRVQNYIKTNLPTAMQAIVNSDPTLKASMQSMLSNFKGGGGVETNPFNVTKDANGNTIPLPGRLANYSATLDIFHSALAMGPANPRDYLSQTQTQEIQTYYEQNILSGKDMKDMLDKGTPLAEAIAIFGNETALFSTFLDPAYVQSKAADLQAGFSNAIKDHLGNSPLSDLIKAFGDANGNIDDAKLTAVLEKMREIDPAMFLDAEGRQIATQDVIGLVRSVIDGSLRQPGKLADALNKLGNSAFLNQLGDGVNSAYKAGVLHLASTLLLGGVTIGRAATTGNATPEQIAALTAGAAGTIGIAMEAGAKLKVSSTAKPVGPGADAIWTAFENRMKTWENAGKTIGGLTNIVGGILNIVNGVNALSKGDTVNGQLSLVGGSFALASGVASSAEGAANLLALFGVRFGINIGGRVLAGFAVAASVMGWAAAFVSAGIMIATGIIDRVNWESTINTVRGNMKDTAQKYGIAPVSQATDEDWPTTNSTGGS